ncbi:MAG: alpha/beta hydrolase [Actinobacteria bacterium]|nr:alpha/beta hydrolase [Actinomycetota bacterium]
MTYAYDPELAAHLEMIPSLDLADVAASRAATEALAGLLPPVDDTGVEIRKVEVPSAAGGPPIPLRTYTPVAGERPLPVIYDIHGGAFVVGSLDLGEARNVHLARELGVMVASVDYRLAPEHPFPAAVDDCYDGLRWIAENAEDLGVEQERIALHGQSAGGGLAAAVALMARDRGEVRPCFQYLGVPCVDDRLTTDSARMFVDTPFVDRRMGELSWRHYLGEGVPGSNQVSPYAAPARAESLEGVAPAYICVMQFDPLRDEGIAYARKLLEAGVPVELHLFPGTFHGSALIGAAAVSQREAKEEETVLRRALRG